MELRSKAKKAPVLVFLANDFADRPGLTHGKIIASSYSPMVVILWLFFILMSFFSDNATLASPMTPFDHPVGQVRCESLPRAGNREVAEFYKRNLEQLGQCPAGYYPHRYGTGKDLAPHEECVEDKINKNRPADAIDGGEPETDMEIAQTIADDYKSVSPCPLGENLEIYKDFDSSHAPPKEAPWKDPA